MTLAASRLNAIFIVLAGIGFLIFGGYLLLTPIGGLSQFGLAIPDDALHRIEIRAFYGGLEIGLGLLLIKFGINHVYHRAGLWLVLASYGAIGFARVTAMMADGQYPRMLLYALLVELLFAVVAAALLVRQKPRLGG